MCQVESKKTARVISQDPLLRAHLLEAWKQNLGVHLLRTGADQSGGLQSPGRSWHDRGFQHSCSRPVKEMNSASTGYGSLEHTIPCHFPEKKKRTEQRWSEWLLFHMTHTLMSFMWITCPHHMVESFTGNQYTTNTKLSTSKALDPLNSRTNNTIVRLWIYVVLVFIK